MHLAYLCLLCTLGGFSPSYVRVLLEVDFAHTGSTTRDPTAPQQGLKSISSSSGCCPAMSVSLSGCGILVATAALIALPQTVSAFSVVPSLGRLNGPVQRHDTHAGNGLERSRVALFDERHDAGTTKATSTILLPSGVNSRGGHVLLRSATEPREALGTMEDDDDAKLRRQVESVCGS